MKTRIFSIFMLLGIISTLNATVYLVTSGADSGAGTLRQAINDANADAASPLTINFSSEVTTVILSSALPTLNKAMTIDGGFGVTITGSSNTVNMVVSATGLTVNFNNITFNGAVVSIGGTGFFTDCTFTGGGAAALKISNTVTCNNCLFYNNTNAGSGGTAINGISSANNLTLNNCIIRDNGNAASNTNGGAAVRIAGGNAASRLEMNNCLVYNNVNKSTGTSFGGGISSAGVTIINNCAIFNNQANRGGGIALQVGTSTYKSKLTMTNTTVSGNSLGSYVGSAFGGGIYIQGGSGLLTDNSSITNTTISGNSTPVIGSPVTNSAGGGVQIGGGGSSTWSPTITFSHCTIYGNSVQGNPTAAISGGGIDRVNGNAVFNYSIVIGNNSNSTAGGRNITWTTGWLTSTTGRNIYEGGAAWNESETAENIVLSESPSTILNTTLTDNGGTTALPDGSFTKTHALLAGSIAINPQASATGWSSTDQRGETRDNAPDMGAFEYIFFPSPVITSITNGDGQVTVYFTQQNESENAVVNYKYSTDGGATYKAFSPAQSTSPVTIKGLHNSSWYSIRLKAITAIEESGESNLMTTVLPSAGEVVPTYVVLLAGQSNMAGRGVIRMPMDTVSFANILSMNKDSLWVTAKHPLHYDKAEAGVGLGMSFATELARMFNNKVKIALVPCAAGGTNITQWLNNDLFTSSTASFNLYSNLIDRAKVASRNGQILGILWHQGESDGVTALNTNYQANLQTLVERIRQDLAISDLPFIAGEMGKYFNEPNSASVNADSISRYTKNLINILPNYDVASSEGLTANPDRIHFNSSSLVTFGQRYAQLMNDQLVKLSLQNLTAGTNQQLDIPVQMSQYVSVPVSGFDFFFHYDAAMMDYTGYSIENELAATGNITITPVSTGKLKVSWTSTSPVAGSGILIKIRVQTKTEGSVGYSIDSIMVNSNNSSKTSNATISVSTTTANQFQSKKTARFSIDKAANRLTFSGIDNPNSVILYDTTGQTVGISTRDNNSISLINLHAGVYLVSYRVDGTQKIQKIIL